MAMDFRANRMDEERERGEGMCSNVIVFLRVKTKGSKEMSNESKKQKEKQFVMSEKLSSSA